MGFEVIEFLVEEVDLFLEVLSHGLSLLVKSVDPGQKVADFTIAFGLLECQFALVLLDGGDQSGNLAVIKVFLLGFLEDLLLDFLVLRVDDFLEFQVLVIECHQLLFLLEFQ